MVSGPPLTHELRALSLEGYEIGPGHRCGSAEELSGIKKQKMWAKNKK